VWQPSQSAPSSPAPGSSWLGRAVDRLYRVCKTTDPAVSEGLAAGPHEVVMRATLPGSSIAVQSSPLAVDIACTDDLPDTGGTSGGCDAGNKSPGWLLLGSLAAMVGLRRRTARRSRSTMSRFVTVDRVPATSDELGGANRPRRRGALRRRRDRGYHALS